MRHKLKSRRSLNTRKNRTRLMYGGVAPAPASSSNIYTRYDPNDVRTTLNNFLTAAYSVLQASEAIKATSDNQNKPTTNPTDSTRGTRWLQRDSSASFYTAADSIQRSLNSLYMALGDTTVGPTISPATDPPNDPEWSPPPSSFL